MTIAWGASARVGSAAGSTVADKAARQKATRAGKALGGRINELKLIQMLLEVHRKMDGRNAHKFSWTAGRPGPQSFEFVR